MAVAETIAENRVAVRQTLAAGHQPERIAREIVFVQFPNDFFARVEFDDFVAVAAIDEQVPVRQRHHFMHVAGNFDLAQRFPVAIQFLHDVFAFAGNEVMSILRFADAAKLVVQPHASAAAA